MTGRIVVATDGSETGARAVDFAAGLSVKLGRPLCVVHVLLHGRPGGELAHMAAAEGPGAPQGQGDPAPRHSPFPSAEEERETARAIIALGERIAQAARDRAAAIGVPDVTTRICAGDAADEILDAAEAEAADILVLGRRGLGRMREMLLGSVSQKVLHHAGCTVAIVP